MLQEISAPEAVRIWRNGQIPVVYKQPGRVPLLARVPYRTDNAAWLRGRGRKIQWNDRFRAWEIPRTRFNDVVARLLARYQQVYVIQSYRPLEKCAPACWEAKGYDCECSCLGENHGSGHALEHIVSETFAFEWGARKLACRLVSAKKSGPPPPSEGNGGTRAYA